MRVFLAIQPPDGVRARVAEAVAQASARVDAKWVRTEDLHVTLVFVGERTEADVAALVASATEVARRHAPVALELGGWRTFDARVLWVGVAGGAAALEALAGELGATLGVVPDHARYTPHLTVARALRKTGDPLLDEVAHERRDARHGSWVADVITIYESRPGGYVVRATVPLHR